MKTAALYQLASEFSCISCGAAFLPEAEHDLCEACFDTFCRWVVQTKSTDYSAEAANKWLARKLLLDAKRLERFGVVGRCEAVTSGPRGFLDTYVNAQCRLNATAIRDNRRVCGLHVRPGTKILFAGTQASDPYHELQQILIRLAAVDQKFCDCLTAAAAASR